MNKNLLKLAAILSITSLMVGCGGSSGGSYSAVDSYYNESAAVESYDGNESYNYKNDSGISSTDSIDNVEESTQKLIKTVDMSLETKNFDELIENIKTKVKECNGYIEQSNISGNSYEDITGRRDAYLKLRIPSDKLAEFVDIVDTLGNVTYKNESVEDVTLQYVDVESHKKALLSEQERLMDLLEQAQSIEDIITIESRLSDVRYQIESYESTMRTLDNKIEYSTVTVNINEVEKITVVKERNFFEEIWYRLSENMQNIFQFIRLFTIWFISSIPYFVIFVVIIIAILEAILRLLFKESLLKKRKKKDKIEEK